MKIGILVATSQREKSPVLYDATVAATAHLGHEVINFGEFSAGTLPDTGETYSYLQMALAASILLESGAVDFIVTGCSSGNGMMLACNSLPGVLCGYVSNPTEAYLFGRINNGNAVSLPLGLQYGWAGEINLRYCLEKLFEEPLGIGYPPEEASRKSRDAAMLKRWKAAAQRPLIDVLPQLEQDLVTAVMRRIGFMNYVNQLGTNQALLTYLEVQYG